VDRAPLHCTATGKVLLAFNHELNVAFRDGGALRRMTHRTLGRAALDRELSVVRRQGVAYSREEFAEGVVCAAAPVFGPDGRVCMALGVAGPLSAVASAEVASMVKRAAHTVSGSIVRSLSVTKAGRKAAGAPASCL
jgi:DNA-binding IclR family transcriptional regulator